MFGNFPSAVMDNWKWLLEKADFIFASLKYLYEKAYDLRPPNTVGMLSNGVDLDQQNFPGANSVMKHSQISLLILVSDSAEKPTLRRFFNFPVIATYDKHLSFLENFAPCIYGFLSGIMFQAFCSIIRMLTRRQ